MMRTGLTLVLTALLLQAVGAQAATLDKDTCARLEEEQTTLEKTGVRATLAKGAAWAKDNLPLDKLQEVRRLIEVDEQILFRCQGKPLVLLPSSVDADPVQTTDDNAPDGEKPADGAAAATKAAPGQGCQGAGTQGCGRDARQGSGRGPGQEGPAGGAQGYRPRAAQAEGLRRSNPKPRWRPSRSRRPRRRMTPTSRPSPIRRRSRSACKIPIAAGSSRARGRCERAWVGTGRPSGVKARPTGPSGRPAAGDAKAETLMTTVLLILHMMIAAAMIGVVLLQRSEGGALGIGGGGGGFMTGRGAANFLTRVTAGLAAAFFVTSLLLSHPGEPAGKGAVPVRQRARHVAAGLQDHRSRERQGAGWQGAGAVQVRRRHPGEVRDPAGRRRLARAAIEVGWVRAKPVTRHPCVPYVGLRAVRPMRLTARHRRPR